MKNSDVHLKRRIPKKTEELEKFFRENVGLGTSFDVEMRHLKILKKDVQLYYVNGLTETQYVIEIIEELVNINDHEKASSKLFQIVQNRLVHESVQLVDTLDEMVDQVLTGLIAIVVEGSGQAFIVDVRNYPGRDPEEPDTEKVIRGSRDGYVENILFNTALTRRRIRDERLRFEILKVGERSKTEVALAYIKDITNPKLIEMVRAEICNIEIDGIPMADKALEEFILKQGFNPFPLVRYTERADVGATHLLEGHILVFVDTSPSVMIMPSTYFHHLQHAEEYRQSAAVGTFIRWMRYIGIFASIFFLPLWYLFALDPSLLPESLSFIGPKEKSEIPLIGQLIIADIGVEFLRIAAIHTPTPLSTAMGLIAAILIGEIAVDVGMFVPEVLLYVSIAAIGTFATPSYELGVANKICRLILLVVVAIFKCPGYLVGSTVFILFLAQMRPLNTPYLWPFIPFNLGAFMQIVLRRSVPGSRKRPSIVQPLNVYKKPKNE